MGPHGRDPTTIIPEVYAQVVPNLKIRDNGYVGAEPAKRCKMRYTEKDDMVFVTEGPGTWDLARDLWADPGVKTWRTFRLSNRDPNTHGGTTALVNLERRANKKITILGTRVSCRIIGAFRTIGKSGEFRITILTKGSPGFPASRLEGYYNPNTRQGKLYNVKGPAPKPPNQPR
jgi:hypothetical protein